MPVLPLVGSTRVAPALSTPRRSASSTMASAMRSLTLPPGLSDSSLASTVAPPGLGMRLRRTSGVPPTRSSTEPAIFGRAGAVARLVVMVSPSRNRNRSSYSFGSPSAAPHQANPFGSPSAAPHQANPFGSPCRGCASPSELDVVHRARRAPPIEGAPAQIVQRGAVHHGRDRLLDLLPQIVKPRRVFTTAAPPRRIRPGRRALHRPQERPHRDLVRGPAEPVAARRPAPRVEKAGALELEQDLLEIALRDALAGRDVLDRLEVLAVVQGEVHHRLDGVLALRRDPHARPCSMSRAASLAK